MPLPFQKSRWALPLDRLFFIALVVTLGAFWLRAIFGIPIEFWSAQLDWPVMPLAEAVNIDFWLREPGERALSQAQYYQPGMWFQAVSYGLYRLTAGSGSPTELFEHVIQEPAWYWLALQTAPLALTGLALALLWRGTQGFSATSRSAALASYFVATASVLYGTWGFFNESFTFALALLFFPLAMRLLRAEQSHPILASALVGLAASGLYLHKMNYVVWAIALIPALCAGALVGRIRWTDALLRIVALMICMVVGILVFGFLLLGSRAGLELMLGAHLQIVLGSGLYGNGDKTLVAFSTLLANIKSMAVTEPAMLLAFAMLTALSTMLAVRRRRNMDWLKRYLPEGVLLLTAAGVMLLALLKHYQPYYVVSVAAVFPFIVIWLTRAGASDASLAAVLLVSTIGFAGGAYTADRMRVNWASAEARMRADDAIIASKPLPEGSIRLWMYLTHNDIAGRIFMLSFVGIDRLLANVVSIQGENYFLSPWHGSVATLVGPRDVSELPWSSIVVDKAWLKWIDRSVHSWVNDPKVKRTEFEQVVLFERE